MQTIEIILCKWLDERSKNEEILSKTKDKAFRSIIKDHLTTVNRAISDIETILSVVEDYA